MEIELCRRILENMSRVIVGKSKSLELLLVALLADGHVLIEDVPGVGKTLMAKCLARSIGGIFKRVQFTPDLLPSDITGFNIYDRKKGGFQFQPGPVMSNVLLADEINRTVPRTQASLLESMEERQVTVDGQTLPLPRPFFVMATQNPIELEGDLPASGGRSWIGSCSRSIWAIRMSPKNWPSWNGSSVRIPLRRSMPWPSRSRWRCSSRSGRVYGWPLRCGSISRRLCAPRAYTLISGSGQVPGGARPHAGRPGACGHPGARLCAAG